MKEKNNLNFKIGDHVWFCDLYHNICSGTIVEFNTGPKGRCAEINSKEYGTTYFLLENLYLSEEELREASQVKARKMIDNYKTNIKDVNDLVQFMYDNTVSLAEEYTNWEARAAVKERAKELLNINL